ncbi:MAG: hypothetical protein KDD66_05315, partial [Bdellovibrionales bacterium]|nr:hypothetical protein [Bdellovibrionales bacterium]
MSSVYQELLALMVEHYPNYVQLWKNSRDEFGVNWEEEFNLHMGSVFGSSPNEQWLEAIHGYAEFCTEAVRAQIFFDKHGRYQASNYSEVLEECYRNSDYMNKRYLPGQYLSHYIWPHHQKMLRGFVSELLPQVAGDVRSFYEVGVGCGMYSQKALEYLPNSTGVGYDISQYALQFTERVVQAHGYGSRYSIKLENIIESPI